MSEHDTILGHIVGWRLRHCHEDAATEGLAFVLERHSQVRERFIALLRTAQPDLPGELRFTTQEPFSGPRPDMCGRHGEELRVFVESKFGAALTDHQPLLYLTRLAERPGSTLLLFIVPEWRRSYLWREILERLTAAKLAYQEITPQVVEIADRPHRQRLQILSWAAVLNALGDGADDSARANLEQLRGLCRIGDELDWQPLVPEELTVTDVPARLKQYVDIARGVVEKGCPDVFRPRRQPPNWYALGSNLQFIGEGVPEAWLGVNLIPWQKHGRSPLWLHIAADRRQAARIKPRLQLWADVQGRVLDENAESVMTEIRLLTGRDKHAVIDDVIDQLRVIGALLRESPPVPATSPTPTVPPDR